MIIDLLCGLHIIYLYILVFINSKILRCTYLYEYNLKMFSLIIYCACLNTYISIPLTRYRCTKEEYIYRCKTISNMSMLMKVVPTVVSLFTIPIFICRTFRYNDFQYSYLQSYNTNNISY